jgi:hypothetical protein
MAVEAGRVIFAATVIAPLLASPMLMVPAVIRSNSASEKLSGPATGSVADPRMIATPAVRGRMLMLPVDVALTVPSRLMLLATSATGPPLVDVVSPDVSIFRAIAVFAAPSMAVSWTLPPPDVMLFGPKRETPKFEAPDPGPPVPWMVTVPLPPVEI